MRPQHLIVGAVVCLVLLIGYGIYYDNAKLAAFERCAQRTGDCVGCAYMNGLRK